MPLDQQAIESKHPKSKMELERSGSNQAEEIETEIAVEAGQVRPLRCPEDATLHTAPESGKGTMELTRSNDRFRLTWNATLRRIPTPLNTDLAGHTVLHGPDELQSRIADCLEANSEEEQMLFDEKVFAGQDLIQSKTNKRQKELGAWEGHKKKHVEMVPQPEYPVEGEVAVAYMVTEVSSEYFPCPALNSKHFSNGQAGLNPHHGAGGTAVPNIHHPACVPAGAG